MPRHLAFDVEHYGLLRHGVGLSAGSLTGFVEADLYVLGVCRCPSAANEQASAGTHSYDT